MSTLTWSTALCGRRRLIDVALLLALLGPTVNCASSGVRRDARNVSQIRRHPSFLSRAELAGPVASSASSLYETLQQLRPLWLNNRGRNSLLNDARVQVALDGQLVGDIANLRAFRADDVEEARILDSAEAGSRYGMRAQAQRVIELRSRRGGVGSD
jgi:hypothetical protein